MASSRKTPQQRRRARSRQRTESESNEVEEHSDSFEVESADDYLRDTNTPQRRYKTSRKFRKEMNTNEDSGEDMSDIIKPWRRSSVVEIKTDLELTRIANEFRSDGAVDHYEIDSPEILEKKRKRRQSRRRRSENRSLELLKDVEEYSKRPSSRARGSSTLKSGPKERTRRKRKSFQGEGEEVELPIAEILKRAQERNRTKYEEPIPLTELTSDTIYVQGRNGFTAMKIAGGPSDSGKKVEKSAGSYSYPIRVAIMVQKVWKCTGFIYQGLLGGMAFMHFILLQCYFSDSSKFLSEYPFICEIYTNIFSFLIIMCLIATFDKFDLAALDVEHLREIYITEAKSAVSIPLYLITFCLHQASLRVDDKLSLMYYNSSNSRINETAFRNSTNVEVPLDEMTTWHGMTLSKDVLAVLAWLFVSLGTRDDMLLKHLEAMEKYVENPYPTFLY